MTRFSPTDAALLFLRVSASVLVLLVHGLPKALHYSQELNAIDDPLHMGKTLTFWFALFAEVACPLLMIAGIATRLAFAFSYPVDPDVALEIVKAIDAD